jgi:sugar phosphate permease
MRRISPQRLSQIAIGVLLLIIVRSLGEFFRLQYVEGEALAIAKVAPFVGSALFTAVVLAAALVGHSWGRYRLVIGGAVATVVMLLIYKIAILG